MEQAAHILIPAIEDVYKRQIPMRLCKNEVETPTSYEVVFCSLELEAVGDVKVDALVLVPGSAPSSHQLLG